MWGIGGKWKKFNCVDVIMSDCALWEDAVDIVVVRAGGTALASGAG